MFFFWFYSVGDGFADWGKSAKGVGVRWFGYIDMLSLGLVGGKGVCGKKLVLVGRLLSFRVWKNLLLGRLVVWWVC